MPTYDFQCRACKHAFEVKRSFSDSSPVHCPKCRSGAKQLYSSLSFVLKGEGFYSADKQKRQWWQRPGMDSAMADAKSTMDKAFGKS
ncbi:MAG: zinc ribbon domain-containing protein [Chloroflexi bacterium]|nr:zinc ribbon domain-containing protein [Chloroflexota bacterium]